MLTANKRCPRNPPLAYLTVDFLRQSILKPLATLSDLAVKRMLMKTKDDSTEDYKASGD